MILLFYFRPVIPRLAKFKPMLAILAVSSAGAISGANTPATGAKSPIYPNAFAPNFIPRFTALLPKIF